MSSNHKLGNNNKELISERSQNNKLVLQNEIVSNTELIKEDKRDIAEIGDCVTPKPSLFNKKKLI